MKKVVKVSIGNIAFTLEEEAHQELKVYLDSLVDYYGAKEGGNEIIEGIEERIAELLTERGYSQKVVTKDAVVEIMDILGRPDEIKSETEPEQESGARRGGRKLYRNLQDKKMGGVCSGLGSYFSLDPTAVRILVLVFALVSALFSEGAGLAFITLLYFALWIIIPGAKTVEEKCEMKGEKASISSIEKKVTEGVNEIVNSEFGNTFKKIVDLFVGALLSILGFIGLGTGVMVILGLNMVDIISPFSGFSGLSMFSGVSPALSATINILMILVTLLPFVGMLYGGILLLFGFKSPKWRPGLLNFFVWIGASIALVVCLVLASADYMEVDRRDEVQNIGSPADTVYVEYANVENYRNYKIFVDADRGGYELFYLNSSRENPSLITYPEFNVRRHTNGESRIRSKCEVFPNTLSVEEWNGADSQKFYDYKENVLTLYPTVYGDDHTIKMVDREVTLFVPEGATVIVKNPIYHDFTKRVEYSDIKYLKKYIFD